MQRTTAGITLLWIPCYTGVSPEVRLEGAFRGIGPRERFATAGRLGETGPMLLVRPALGEAEKQDTVRAVGNVIGQAVR
jgi:hypothetical protein